MTTAITSPEPALPLEGGRLHATNASELCSAGLWRRLTDEGDKWGDAVRSIAGHAGMLAEVVEVRGELARRAEKAQPVEILAELIALGPIYGISDKSDDEWSMLFGAYLEALAPLPLEAIRQGIVDWNREGEFFPKPGQIYTRADPYARKLRMAAYRAARAAEWVEKNPPEKSEAERLADRQKLIDAGLMTPDGEFAPLTFRKVDRGPAAPKETPQEMAERLARLGDGTKTIETERLPTEEPEEAI